MGCMTSHGVLIMELEGTQQLVKSYLQCSSTIKLGIQIWLTCIGAERLVFVMEREICPKRFPYLDKLIHYQDLEWYEALEDSELKDEALRNKAIMEGLISDDESSNNCWKK
ncbi:hypothetical protein Tco_1059062 [Tanacetum coccineum]